MILNKDRRRAKLLVAIGGFYVIPSSDDLFRCPRLRPRFGWRWLWNRMRERQAPDTAHHAPCCPANRWSGAELVVQPCTCGAHRRRDSQSPKGQGLNTCIDAS